MIKKLFFIFMFFISIKIHAETVFDSGFFVYSKGTGSADVKERSTVVNTLFAYNWLSASQFYYGLRLNVDTNYSKVTEGDAALNILSGVGLNFGMSDFSQGWLMGGIAQYSPTDRYSGSFTYTRYGGIGYGVEFGYLYSVGNATIGPRLTYMIQNFTKEKVGTDFAKLNNTIEISQITPYFTYSIKM